MSLNTRRFIRSTAGTSFWLGLVTVIVGTAQSVFAQSAASSGGVIITQEVAFAWPIMVFIVAAAAIWAKLNASITSHHADRNIHLTQDEIAKGFQRRNECLLTHAAEHATLARIEQRVESVEAKLDKALR